MVGKLQWWQTRWFVAVAAVISAIPLLLPQIPPFVDLPGHMGRYRVQLAMEHAPWLGDWYSFKWALIGNLGVDLLVIPLAPVFGLELAVKLIVITIPVLTVIGILWIAREVHGRVPATTLFALPLAYCFPLHFGFVNFALSMALALNCFALWLRMGRTGHRGARAALFLPLSGLLWLCHTYGWGMLGVLAFSAEMIREHDRLPGGQAPFAQRARHWLLAWVRAGVGCLPLMPPLLLMIAWRSGEHVTGQTGDWFNWRAKIGWMAMVMRDRWSGFDIGSTAVLYIMMFKGLRDPDIEYSRNLGLSVLFLAAVFVLLPRVVFGSAYADMRLAPFLVAIALVALRPRPGMSMRGTATVALLGLCFFLVRIGGNTLSLWLYDQSYQRELKALDHLPEGARLVSFVGETCHNEWTLTRLQHLPALALERKLAYSNDQWSMPGAQLLTTHYFPARRYSHDPSQIVTVTQCPREWWRPVGRSLARFPRDAFDYVWLISPPPYQKRLEAGLIPVWRDGTSALFRIDHNQPGPELTLDLITPPPPSGTES